MTVQIIWDMCNICSKGNKKFISHVQLIDFYLLIRQHDIIVYIMNLIVLFLHATAIVIMKRMSCTK